MNTRIANKWIKALESGKYVQGKGVLKTGTTEKPKHCCLGVLCELYMKENPGEAEWEYNVDSGEFAFVLDDDVGLSLLPERIRYWSEMKSTDGTIPENFKTGPRAGLRKDLASINDSPRGTFKKIAEYIRKYRKEL